MEQHSQQTDHLAKTSIAHVFGTMQRLGALINSDETHQFIHILDSDMKQGILHHQSIAKKYVRDIGKVVGVKDINELPDLHKSLEPAVIDKALTAFDEIQPQVLFEIKIFEAAKAVMAS